MAKKVYRKYKDYHKEENGVLYKKCIECDEWKIADLEHFKLNNGTKSKLSDRCTPCQEVYNREGYLRTRDKQIETAKKRQNENKEALSKYNHEYYMKNKKYFYKKFMKYLENNLEKQKMAVAIWRKNNPELVKKYSKNHRQKEHRITAKEWSNCKHYFANRCAYCGLGIEDHWILRRGKLILMDLHKEHAIDDGKDNLKNCIPSCQSCNSSKREYSLNNWYNTENPNYTYERYHKIYQWLRYDYKKYITKRVPKQKYERKN